MFLKLPLGNGSKLTVRRDAIVMYQQSTEDPARIDLHTDTGLSYQVAMTEDEMDNTLNQLQKHSVIGVNVTRPDQKQS